MKKAYIYALVSIIALGVGFGIGYFLQKPKDAILPPEPEQPEIDGSCHSAIPGNKRLVKMANGSCKAVDISYELQQGENWLHGSNKKTI
jgi:hypothetical protein